MVILKSAIAPTSGDLVGDRTKLYANAEFLVFIGISHKVFIQLMLGTDWVMWYAGLTHPTRTNGTLENGDHLTRSEFERRYAAAPHIKKAELLEGID
ncbi:hypothetical protein ACN23B_10930 [Anabaena sp. FACHB-709]|nr:MULTISPECIES: hypothetical protein [Nostocaceae]